MTTPAIYVGTYHKYNCGSIEGAWLKLEDYADADEFWGACRELHNDEHDPEFMFQDYEGFPSSLYSESAGPENIDRLFAWINLDEYERDLVEAYIDATDADGTIESLLEEAQDHIFAVFDGRPSDNEFGLYVVNEGLFGFKIPEELERFIDYEAIGSEWLSDMYVTNNGYVFTA